MYKVITLTGITSKKRQATLPLLIIVSTRSVRKLLTLIVAKFITKSMFNSCWIWVGIGLKRNRVSRQSNCFDSVQIVKIAVHEEVDRNFFTSQVGTLSSASVT